MDMVMMNMMSIIMIRMEGMVMEKLVGDMVMEVEDMGMEVEAMVTEVEAMDMVTTKVTVKSTTTSK